MISTQTAVIILGVAGLGFLFAPELFGSVRSMFGKKSAAGDKFDVVAMLTLVIDLRNHLSDDPKAIDAIDTVVTPAIIRKEGARNYES